MALTNTYDIINPPFVLLFQISGKCYTAFIKLIRNYNILCNVILCNVGQYVILSQELSDAFLT